ncbi:hypothetical protein RND81_01G063200 [Saponaria officinalis]|uniref:Uncharacterized protein n=1 Tax=Saponaria officinalis TaxID=3572 RepID=A0AAW1ND44_SAPOF
MADNPASSATSHQSDHNHEEGIQSTNVTDRDLHHNKSPQHHSETHGTSDDIDETTPVEAVKGPSVFQRMKEEVEAVVEAILPKKDSEDPK